MKVEKVFGKQTEWRVKRGVEWAAELAFIRTLPKAKRPEWMKQLRAQTLLLGQIPCKRGRAAFGRGHIYAHGPNTLAFTGKGLKLRRELLAIEGVTPHVTGDEEFTVKFPVECMDQVARVVRAIRRRRVLKKESVLGPTEAFLGSNFNDRSSKALRDEARI